MPAPYLARQSVELVRLPKYVRIRTFAGLADEVVLIMDGPLEVLVRDLLDLAVEPLDGLRAELVGDALVEAIKVCFTSVVSEADA